VQTTVLYLDDERGCLDVFYETFTREYDVRITTSAEEARRMLAERRADIVISDQKMPGVTGREFLAEVAATHPTAYRILLTGSITVGVAINEVGAGVVHAFVVKPWTAAGMLRVLERAAGAGPGGGPR
jgi:DNA-binding NtrC family response regulator